MTKTRLIWLILLLAIAVVAALWSLNAQHDRPSVPSSVDRLAAQAAPRTAELEAPPQIDQRSTTNDAKAAAQNQPLLVAGIVVDDAGTPVSDAQIIVDYKGATHRIDMDPHWGTTIKENADQLGKCSSDELGRFQFESTFAGGALSLVASHVGATDPAWGEAQTGEKNARLVLHMAGSMHVRIVLPGNEVVSGLHVGLNPSAWTQSVPSISTDEEGRLVAQIDYGGPNTRMIRNSHNAPPTDKVDAVVELGSGQSAIRATFSYLAPDDWGLMVSVDMQPGPIASISGLTVRSHRWSDDPRVNSLDLRGLLALVKLSIEDPTGAPIPTGLLRFRSGGDRENDHTKPFENGTSKFYARIGAELDVSATGFCTQRVIAADGERKVVLQHGQRVRLVLDGAGVPAPPLLLRVALVRQPVANDKHTWFVVDTQDEERIANLAARSTIHWYGAGQFDGSGSADAKVEGPGEYHACWYVGQRVGTGDSIQIVRILPVDPARVLVPENPDEASLRIHLDAGDLAAAVERL